MAKPTAAPHLRRPRRRRPGLRRVLVPALAAALLGACGFPEEALWPVEGGEATAQVQAAAEPAPTPTETETAEPATTSLPLGQERFAPTGVSPGVPRETPAEEEVEALRVELAGLQDRLATHDARLHALRGAARRNGAAYDELTAALEARLQAQAVPGDADLVRLWNEAEGELAATGRSLAALNGLSNDATATATRAAFLLASIRGALDRGVDHEMDRRELATLDSEAGDTVAVSGALADVAARDAARGQSYLADERGHLARLAVGVARGKAYAGPVPVPASVAGAALVGRAVPLVIIRFDDPGVDYEVPLYGAVSEALRRRPGAVFDLVAVTPSIVSGAGLPDEDALRNAEAVLRSLTAMGVPTERIFVAATASPLVGADEVHLYVR